MGWMRKNEGPVSPTGHNDRVRLVWSKLLLVAAAAASSNPNGSSSWKQPTPHQPNMVNPARGKGPTAPVHKRGPDLSAGGDEDDWSRQELGRRRPPVRGAATNGAR